VREWGWMLLGRYETTYVRNVCHENGSHLICNLAELGKVNDAWVCGSTTENHCWAEYQSSLAQLIKIDESSLRVDFVRQRLEVD
jgi:hypothetical protein